MGVKMYWIVTILSLLLGMILPQKGPNKRLYIILIAILHICVCGFRYQYLTGDLMKYANGYVAFNNSDISYSTILFTYRNPLWEFLRAFFSRMTNGNFQLFLFIISLVVGVITAVFIDRYSPCPWMSYVVFNCMSFYISYDFSAIKQGLAMAVLLCSMMCIFEKRPILFFLVTYLAGLIHGPAFAFLPMYYIARLHITKNTLYVYLAIAAIVFLLRQPIVDLVTQFYYSENVEFVLEDTHLGGRFFVIVLMLLTGLFIRGFENRGFEQLFNVIVVAAFFQMFSGFDNIFTRYADYFLQFTILYIPMIFYEDEVFKLNKEYLPSVYLFSEGTMRFFVVGLTVILFWWYDITCLGSVITYEVDNYLNYRSMWDVKEETEITYEI